MRQEAAVASDLIRSAYRGAWWSLMLRGLFSLALGVFILWRPMDSIASFALVIAFWALFGGLVQMINAFELRRAIANWWVVLLSGLISVAFGVAALYYYPQLSLSFAVVWATWLLFLVGGLAVSAALMERRLGMGWGWTLAFGIVAIAAGVLAIMNPPATLAAIMGLIAGFALVSGAVLVTTAFALSALKHELERADSRPGQRPAYS